MTQIVVDVFEISVMLNKEEVSMAYANNDDYTVIIVFKDGRTAEIKTPHPRLFLDRLYEKLT